MEMEETKVGMKAAKVKVKLKLKLKVMDQTGI